MTMKKDIERYLNHNLRQEQRVAENFHKSFEPTYMSSDVIDYVENVPMEFKIHGGERKFILKELGRKLELPGAIVDKPKKAVQYGSGTLSLLRGLAKKENLEIHEYLKTI